MWLGRGAWRIGSAQWGGANFSLNTSAGVQRRNLRTCVVAHAAKTTKTKPKTKTSTRTGAGETTMAQTTQTLGRITPVQREATPMEAAEYYRVQREQEEADKWRRRREKARK